MKKIVILISGRGSNMQALLSADLPCSVAVVISNRADANGLEVAKKHGIATRVVAHRDYADRHRGHQVVRGCSELIGQLVQIRCENQMPLGVTQYERQAENLES